MSPDGPGACYRRVHLCMRGVSTDIAWHLDEGYKNLDLLPPSFEFTVWFVPNLLENAVAVSIIGFFLGPIYPVMLNVAGRKLPKEYVNFALLPGRCHALE